MLEHREQAQSFRALPQATHQRIAHRLCPASAVQGGCVTSVTYMVAYERTQQDIDSIMESADRIAAAGKHATESARGLDAIATESTAVAIKMAKQLITIKTKASQRGKSAANDLHGRPGGSRDKQAAIRAAWATGKYKSRDVCAEEECAALNMAFGTARKALRNTPEPLRRCTA